MSYRHSRRWRGGHDSRGEARRDNLIYALERTVLHDRVLGYRLLERVDRDREHGEAAVLDLGQALLGELLGAQLLGEARRVPD